MVLTDSSVQCIQVHRIVMSVPIIMSAKRVYHLHHAPSPPHRRPPQQLAPRKRRLRLLRETPCILQVYLYLSCAQSFCLSFSHWSMPNAYCVACCVCRVHSALQRQLLRSVTSAKLYHPENIGPKPTRAFATLGISISYTLYYTLIH